MIEKLKALNEWIHSQSPSREKYYTVIIVSAVTFVVGYLVGKF